LSFESCSKYEPRSRHNDPNVGVYADVIAGGTIRRGDPVALARSARFLRSDGARH
jgi:MOSC domain-containing protein YiiM